MQRPNIDILSSSKYSKLYYNLKLQWHDHDQTVERRKTKDQGMILFLQCQRSTKSSTYPSISGINVIQAITELSEH